MLNRRQLLSGAGAGACGLMGGFALARDQAPRFDLHARRTSYAFDRPETQGLVSLADNAPPPVLRLKQGQEAVLALSNGLDEYTTLHWHGLRIPNAMDGVPYLTQFPVAPGETFEYRYTPPDAGTFWYHPHCRTMEQMAHGLTGIMVVEEADDPGFDADIELNLKDFRLADDGTLLPYFTARGAARGGTLGNQRTVNWQIAPSYDAPAGGLVRLRIAVTDTTRVYKLVLPDVPGRIIAWDGQPVEEEVPWPSADAPLWLGPGQRVDVLVQMPEDEGAELPLTTLIGLTPEPLVHLRAVGASLGHRIEDAAPLPANPFAHPVFEDAEMREVIFGWSPEGNGTDNGLCGTFGYTFWSIDRAPWPGDAVPGVGPVMELELGKSYILRLRNESPNFHPIHLHGLVFKPIASNQRVLPANYTDTLLLFEEEVVDVLLLADNPGDWAFHCHVIEHQKSGLTGYIRVV